MIAEKTGEAGRAKKREREKQNKKKPLKPAAIDSRATRFQEIL